MGLNQSNSTKTNGNFPSAFGSNLLIQGDNCEVLASLRDEFSGRVKCIYIDPPYNNGEVYHYYNDNDEHGNWLNNVSRVLSLLKPLMSSDGSIWISIDDREMAYLKVAADKIFGRDNFLATIIWQQRKSRENRSTFSFNHEYILVYAKNPAIFRTTRNLLPVDEEFIRKNYKNPDKDPRGPWQSVTANVQNGHAVSSQFYTVVSPLGIRHNPPKGRCWIYNEDRMKDEIAKGDIWFGKNGRCAPRVKKFLDRAKIGLTPETIWTADEVGTTDTAKKQLKALFPDHENAFDTPKPEELIKRIIEISSNKGDYVLDCYLGSGTTIATAHKLQRHYIGIEVGRQMSEIAVKRMSKVVNGEQSGISREVKWSGGGDFAFYVYEDGKASSENKSEIHESVNPSSRIAQPPIHYKQLDFIEVLRQYPDRIVENPAIAKRRHISGDFSGGIPTSDDLRNVLVCLVKPDNERDFMDGSATIYYTGKRFPSSVALNKLYYFVPYIKHRGIKDLYLIRIARIGTRKEGQIDNDPNDLRLVFEIKFVRHLFSEYRPIQLQIWRTFTDTKLRNLLTGEDA